jgi:hypothetical protein
MKETFLKTTAALKTLTWLKMSDRDRGQIDHYETRPQVLFPCALVSISMPKRKNYTIGGKQQRMITITIRLACERLIDGSSLNTDANRAKALDYYDKAEAIDEMFQGFTDPYFTTAWECTATVDEQRADFDIMRFTFSTMIIK